MKEKNSIYKDFNLPSYISGKTFAEASKLIDNKFKERTDKVSTETKQELLERLASAQEHLKMMDNASKNGTNTFFGGGVPDIDPNTGMTPGNSDITGIAGSLGDVLNTSSGVNNGDGTVGAIGSSIEKLGGQDSTGIVSGVGTTMGFANDIFGKTNIDTSGETRGPDVKVGAKVAGNAIKGAAAGAKIGGGWGAAVGGALGITSGLIGGKKAKKDSIEADHNNTLKTNAQYRQSDFKVGGYTNPITDLTAIPLDISPTAKSFNPGSIKTNYDPTKITPTKSNIDASLVDNNEYDYNKGPLNANSFAKFQKKDKLNKTIKKIGEGAKQAAGDSAEYLKENYGSLMRYAPIIGNLTDKVKRTVTPRGSRLDNVYNPQEFDEARILNLVNQNNVDKALTESSGGDLGALRTNIIGSNLSKLKASSDAYFKANEVNKAEQRAKFQYGQEKDKTNVILDQDFLNRSAQNEGAYQTAKSAKRAALFEDIGKVGKEEAYKKMVKEIFNYSWDGTYVRDKIEKQEAYKKMVKERFGYTWQGKYWVDSKGNKVEDSVVRAKIGEQEDGNG